MAIIKYINGDLRAKVGHYKFSGGINYTVAGQGNIKPEFAVEFYAGL